VLICIPCFMIIYMCINNTGTISCLASKSIINYHVNDKFRGDSSRVSISDRSPRSGVAIMFFDSARKNDCRRACEGNSPSRFGNLSLSLSRRLSSVHRRFDRPDFFSARKRFICMQIIASAAARSPLLCLPSLYRFACKFATLILSATNCVEPAGSA